MKDEIVYHGKTYDYSEEERIDQKRRATLQIDYIFDHQDEWRHEYEEKQRLREQKAKERKERWKKKLFRKS